jgi:hypothetical protein
MLLSVSTEALPPMPRGSTYTLVDPTIQPAILVKNRREIWIWKETSYYFGPLILLRLPALSSILGDRFAERATREMQAAFDRKPRVLSHSCHQPSYGPKGAQASRELP